MSKLTDLFERDTVVSLLRYLTVGVVSNGLLYAAYLLITHLGLPPVVATSLLYVTGVGGTYLANRGWSFQSSRTHSEAAPRYAMAYGAGYGVQVATLSGLTYLLHVPHQFAQLCAMGGAAVTIYAGLKFWVFPNEPKEEDS